jgi:hypothetical protein
VAASCHRSLHEGTALGLPGWLAYLWLVMAMLHLRQRGLMVARQSPIHGNYSLSADFPDFPSFISLRVWDSGAAEWRGLW